MYGDVVTVREAADLLGVSPRRVHALIHAGELVGERVAGRVVLWRGAVEAYERRGGRKPLEPGNAWGVLAKVAGVETDEDVDRRRRWRLARQLEELVAAGADWSVWLSRLRRRGDVRPFRVNPSLVDRLAGDPRLVRTGVSAARDCGLDVVAAGEVDAYVHAGDVGAVTGEYVLEAATKNPNVTLRVVPDHIDPSGRRGEIALLPAVLLDLLDSDDARSRRAGAAGFQRLLVEPTQRGKGAVGS